MPNLLITWAVLMSIVVASSTLSPTCDPVIYTEFYPSKEKCKCILSDNDSHFTKV